MISEVMLQKLSVNIYDIIFQYQQLGSLFKIGECGNRNVQSYLKIWIVCIVADCVRAWWWVTLSAVHHQGHATMVGRAHWSSCFSNDWRWTCASLVIHRYHSMKRLVLEHVFGFVILIDSLAGIQLLKFMVRKRTKTENQKTASYIVPFTNLRKYFFVLWVLINYFFN